MFKRLKNSEEGFTIIEVLIVLAIAGLIMVIVFLAVPALQRNSRNTQRANDASRIAAGVNECMTNNNGNLTTCDTAAELANYVVVANNQQLSTLTNAAPGADTNTAGLRSNTQCNAAGTDVQAGGGTRAFTITYNAETGGGVQLRCIAG